MVTLRIVAVLQRFRASHLLLLCLVYFFYRRHAYAAGARLLLKDPEGSPRPPPPTGKKFSSGAEPFGKGYSNIARAEKCKRHDIQPLPCAPPCPTPQNAVLLEAMQLQLKRQETAPPPADVARIAWCLAVLGVDQPAFFNLLATLMLAWRNAPRQAVSGVGSASVRLKFTTGKQPPPHPEA